MGADEETESRGIPVIVFPLAYRAVGREHSSYNQRIPEADF